MSAVVTALGALTTAAALYLLVLAVAAFFHREQRVSGPCTRRLVVLVPAHNEAALVGRCVASLLRQTYPRALYRVIVIADNCDDDTAAVAAAAGADVMVRREPEQRGKGQALRWATDRLLDGDTSFDAVVIVDADSVADEDLLRALAARMDAGADVVQGEYLVLQEPGGRSALRAAAFLLFHRTRFAGRDVLGMGCALVGNGMLLGRGVLERLRWSAFSGAEDLEYTCTLRLNGIVPRFASGARVLGPAPTGGRAGRTQRARWEGGRFHVMRTRLGPLVWAAVRRRRWNLLDAAADLAVPPLGLLVLLATAGGLLSVALAAAGALRWRAALPWALTLLVLAVYVPLGLRAARAPASAYRALLSAPRFLLAKVGTYARLSRGLQADRWERTERQGEARKEDPARVEVGEVPVDRVDTAQAVDRIVAAIDSRVFTQVCTVNLQFVAGAHRDSEVRQVLQRSALNVADGVSVLLLARLAGHRLPERIAGLDLVCALMPELARRRGRIFLLGGSACAAQRTARKLTERFPGLVICGIEVPAILPVEQIGTDGLCARIDAARPDLLLVAFGHPKQELWIDRNRELLGQLVAMGVGCTFDVLSGQRHRAPRWMQRAGLEWLYRAVHEPRRLLPRYARDGALLLASLIPGAVHRRLLPKASRPVLQTRTSIARTGHRLAGIDGLRAFAAMWVVLFHVRAFSGARLPLVDVVVRSGSTGVSLFLVLSGFCLFLPFAGGRAGRFATRRFLVRRCRRLMPAYYVSLLLILAVTATAGVALGLAGYGARGIAAQAAAHLSLVHTLFPSTFYALNGAYWSLGLEWQLYLTLPLLVIGVRRLGLARVAIAVVAVNVVYRLVLDQLVGHGMVAADSILATAVLPNLFPGRWAEFVLGMVAAELYATGRVAGWAGWLRWAPILLVPLALVAVGSPLSHLLFGGVFFVLVAVVLSGNNLVSRAFSWRPLVALGVMSYSLYLVHQPLVQVGAHLLSSGGASPRRVFVEMVMLLPVVIAAAWLLFVTVERRSLTSSGREQEATAPRAAIPESLQPALTPLAAYSSAARRST
jgi:1,2-diacylglycerol 3-beta-glucosyltransferase